jgi:hypothetical protein
MNVKCATLQVKIAEMNVKCATLQVKIAEMNVKCVTLQVKIAEMNVQIGDSPRPNLSRLATVCDLFDKVAATKP